MNSARTGAGGNLDSVLANTYHCWHELGAELFWLEHAVQAVEGLLRHPLLDPLQSFCWLPEPSESESLEEHRMAYWQLRVPHRHIYNNNSGPVCSSLTRYILSSLGVFCPFLGPLSLCLNHHCTRNGLWHLLPCQDSLLLPGLPQKLHPPWEFWPF